MLEGEEIFESASETGYRLCRSGLNEGTVERPDDNEIFSATWDKNNRNRLFICSQNGLLKVYDLEKNNMAKYEVLFRRYTTFENLTEPEKRINQHWSKMVTIADRPNEMIFLLGVSNVLMYTCLPGSDGTEIDAKYPNSNAAIAALTRSDFPGYIYGTPVMEISSHVSRVTSMAVSPAGHVLASGDETGNVRLLLLQLLDSISCFKKEEVKKKKHLKNRLFNEFKSSYNITNQAHAGSVFSMDWLPVMNTKDDVRYYGLVTGSIDRAVRIWTVSCCSRNGLQMIPCQLLDTPSTHILSLCTYELTDKVQEMAMARTISRRRLMNDKSDRHEDLLTAYSSKDIPNYNEAETLEMNSTKSIYIAAGTNIGTIYVWKLSLVNIMASLMSADNNTNSTNVAASKSTITRTPNTFAIDDGTALLSLLQTSDKPIIHVSITSNGHQTITTADLLSSNKLVVDTSKLNSADNVILAASDISNVVRLHCVDKYADKNSLDDFEEMSFLRMPDSPTKGSVRGSVKSEATRMSVSERVQQEALRSHTNMIEGMRRSLRGNYKLNMQDTKSNLSGGESVMTTNKPLVLVGEQVYDSNVVACVFQAVYVAPVAAEKYDDTEVVDHVSPPGLVVCTCKGEIKYYSSDTLPKVLDPSMLKSGLTPAASPDTSSKSSGSLSSVKSSPASTPEKAEESKVLFLSPNVGEDDVSEGSDLSDEPKENLYDSLKGSNSFRMKRTSSAMSKMSMLTTDSRPSPIIKKSSLSPTPERLSETDIEPRQNLPSPAAPFAKKTSFSNITTTIKSGSNKIITTKTTTSTTASSSNVVTSNTATTLATASTTNTKTVDTTSSSVNYSPPNPVIAKSEKPKPIVVEDDSLSFPNTNKPVMYTSKLSKQVVSQSLESTSEIEPKPLPVFPAPQQKAIYPTISNNTTKSVLPPQPPVQTSPLPAQLPIEPSERISYKYTNNFANPAVNHSKILVKEITSMMDKIQDDDISVSTLATTQTDRLVASRIAPVDQATQKQRYSRLTAIDVGDDVNLILAKNQSTKPKKQVDAVWLARKQYGGPSEDDLKVLAMPEPWVHRTINFNSNKGNSNYKYNSEYGLYCDMDKNTLQPKFKIEVNASEVLGKVNVIDSIKFGAESRENYRINSMLSMISSAVL